MTMSYTRSDSKWSELVGHSSSWWRDDDRWGLKGKLLQKLPDMSSRFFWLDIFCLDQFSADKMKTIVRSNEIYEWASEYYGMGVGILERLWCLAETGRTGQNARRRKEMIMVIRFSGYLMRREQAYMFTKLWADATFEGSRCTVASDREIVERRVIDSGFASLEDFNVFVKGVVDKRMAWARQGIMRKRGGQALTETERARVPEVTAMYFSFKPSDDEADKCERCDKQSGHLRGDKKFCYDFLL